MPIPGGSGMKFFVYIIESPSDIDMYHDTSEGEMLAKSLKLQRVPSARRVVVSQEAFEASLKIGLVEEMNNYPKLFPIVHISAHGGSDGIELTNKQIINWETLREYLLPVNAGLDGLLFLSMSCCQGYAASRMAMQIGTTQHPFYAMVANSGTPTWSETAVGFSTLYHLIAKGYYVYEAVEAMRVASANQHWVHTTAEKEQQNYIEFATKKDPEFVQAMLTQAISQKPPSELAKMVNKGMN